MTAQRQIPVLKVSLEKVQKFLFLSFFFTSLFDCSRQVNTLHPLAVLSHGQVGTADIKSHVASFLRFCVTMTKQLNKKTSFKSSLKFCRPIVMTITLFGAKITASKFIGSSEPE